MSTAPTLVIHSMCAVAINAETAAHQIRQTISDWQPELTFGFQGRQVMVVRESQMVHEGNLMERQIHVCAAGTDGNVREWAAWARQSAEAGRISFGDPEKAATVAQFDALIDTVLSNAMPLSFLSGIETSMDFHVRPHHHLLGAKGDRLRMYQDAAIAPVNPREDPKTHATIWPVNFGLLPEESLYALLELHGQQFSNIFDIRPTVSYGSGIELFVSAYQHWQQEARLAA